MKYLFLIFITLCLLACGSSESETKAPDKAASETAPKPEPAAADANKSTTVYCWVDKLRLRNAPDTKSAVLGEIKEGEALTFLNKKSDFTQQINLRGKIYDEPWLKVRTADGTEGWIFGGGVKFYKPIVDLAPTPYDKCEKMRYNQKIAEYNTCLMETAEKQLRKDKRYIRKTDGAYEITLLHGNKVVLAEGDSVKYEYRNYIAKMGYFVFKVMGMESGHHLLVNDKSGKKIKIWGYPKPSPDFKNMLVSNVDLVAGFEANGIQLWGFTDKGFRKLFEQEMPDYEPHLPKWIDTYNVQLSLQPAMGREGLSSKLMKLKLNEEGNWVVVE